VNPDTIASLAREALTLTLLISAPLVGTAALLGILFGLLQALTQLQDQTTTFAVKLAAVLGLLLILLPWMGKLLDGFGERLMTMIVEVR
jgi:type III secretion HrpO family protein